MKVYVLLLLALALAGSSTSAAGVQSGQLKERLKAKLQQHQLVGTEEALENNVTEVNNGLIDSFVAGLKGIIDGLGENLNKIMLKSQVDFLSGQAASLFSDFLVSPREYFGVTILELIEKLNYKIDDFIRVAQALHIIEEPSGGAVPVQEQVIEQGETLSFFDALQSNDPTAFAQNLFQETLLVRYLESEGASKYSFKCTASSSNPVVQALAKEHNFNSGLIPDPTGATLNFEIQNGKLTIIGSPSDADVIAAIGCAFFSEEVYHVVLHLMEGIYQYALLRDRIASDDPFLHKMMNMEQHDVSEKYAQVQVLGFARDLVWEKTIPFDETKTILANFITDYTTYDPFKNIDASDLPAFASTPVYQGLQKLAEVNFGYSTSLDTSVYINSQTTVKTSKENLVKAQLALALYHTQTFVWQFGVVLSNFEHLMNHMGSGLVLQGVLFPDIPQCLSSEQDASVQYAAILNGIDSSSPQYTGLNTYATWLNDLRTSGLTGIAQAYDSKNCISCATWI